MNGQKTTIPLKEEDSSRPFRSVMIPTHNRQPHCHGASEIVRRIDAGRVAFRGEGQNRGLADSWNLYVERARGNWVHILPQDARSVNAPYLRCADSTGEFDLPSNLALVE
jgi:hypothetical protein